MGHRPATQAKSRPPFLAAKLFVLHNVEVYPMPTPSVPAKHYINQKEVCELACISRSTCERMERDGSMPQPRRFGRRCKRYYVPAIMQWLEGTWTPVNNEVSHV